VGTTVWIDESTRADLRRLQDAFALPSANATIRRLIEAPALDARALFAIHREAIRAILRKHHLRELIAFGSRARAEGTITSDLDLAARPDPRASPLAVLAAETDLEQALGIGVNLVELPNPRLAKAIQRDGVAFG
jgi:predicted nucleotidyltransferase